MILCLHGGKLRYSNSVLGDGTYRMSLSDDFAEDVDSMWDLCRTDPAQWNMNLNALELRRIIKCRMMIRWTFF